MLSIRGCNRDVINYYMQKALKDEKKDIFDNVNGFMEKKRKIEKVQEVITITTTTNTITITKILKEELCRESCLI